MPHVELPQAEFKVVMLGDTNVGKTSLVLRFAEGYYRDNSRSPTVGAFFITKRVQSASTGVTCKVQIWDTAGQTKFQKMAPMYYTNAAAVVICYDVSNLYSFERAKEWTNEVLENAKANNRNIVFAIVATKSDLIYQAQIQAQCEAQQQQSMDMNIDINNNSKINSNYRSTTKINFVPTKQGMELAQSINGIFMDTSARNDENVDLLFQKVAEQVLFVREQQRIHGMNYNYWSSSPTTTAASVGNENAVGNLNAAGTGVSSVGTVGGINVGTSSNGTSTTPTTAISTNSNSIKNGGGGDYSYKNGNGGNTHYPTTPTKTGRRRRVRNSLHNDPNGNSMNMNSNNTPTIYDNDHEDDENYDYDNSRGNDLFNSGTIPINQNDRDPNGNKENYNSNHHGRKEQHQQQNQGGARVGINSFDLTNQKNQQSASSTTTSAVGLCYGCSSNDGSESSSCMIQ